MNKQSQGGRTQNQHPETNKGFQNGAQDNRASKKDQDVKINPTNRDNKVTNKQNEEDVEENSIPNPDSTQRDDGSPEINTPVYTPDPTEEKIPKF